MTVFANINVSFINYWITNLGMKVDNLLSKKLITMIKKNTNILARNDYLN